MNASQNGLQRTLNASETGEPLYWVVLSVADGRASEERIQEVVERSRGDLRGVLHRTQQAPARLHLRLGVRRIDDVLAALEGAGFDVHAVVATAARR